MAQQTRRKKDRILHSPVNIAGQPFIISRAQRLLGYSSDVLVVKKNRFGYVADIDLGLKDKRKIISNGFILLKNFIFCLTHYDIFHFHSALTLLPGNLDLPIYKLFGKKVIMEYWGSDVIQTDLALQYSYWTKENLSQIYPNINNRKKRRQLAWINYWANGTIVGDYSLLVYSKGSKVIRQAVNLDDFSFIGSDSQERKIKIIHAPTNNNIKGTKFVLQAIGRLKKEKFPIEFILLENTAHDKAQELYKKADIVVDSLLHGPYGILSIECMALGKPVVGRIEPKLCHFYNNLPMVNSNPDNLYQDLVKLIRSPRLRARLGVEGRKYVENYHDSKSIAKQLINYYKKI